MYHSPIQGSLEFDHGFKVIPKAYVTFYLNRYPFQILESDEILEESELNNYTYGFTDMMSVQNISETYRYGHGNSYTVLGALPRDSHKLTDYRIQNRVPQNRLYVASEESSYKYYMSPISSEYGDSSPSGMGYLSSTGTYMGKPQIEYFDSDGSIKCLPGNTLVMKWNTASSSPTNYKIWIKSREIDTSDTPEWNMIYDSGLSGQLPIRTGERYGIQSIENSDGLVTRIQLAKFDDTLPPPNIATVTGYTTGNRRAWSEGDYMDFDIDDSISISNVDNSINGVSKIINLSKSDGWVEVSASAILSKDIDITDPSIELYVLNAGEISIFSQENGEWSSKPNYWAEDKNNLVDIAGARVEILGLDRPGSRAELIELSPALSADFSEYIVSVDITEALSEKAVNIPIGVISANSGSIVLSNSTGVFDKSNTRRRVSPGVWGGSYFAELLTDNIEFKIYNEITSLQDGTKDRIPMTPMVSDVWAAEGNNQPDFSTVTVNLLDYSRILQNRSCPDLLLNNYPITSIIYMLLDKCAFSRVLPWPENSSSGANEPVVKYFWSKSEDAVWDTLQELARSTQTSIFFDRYGYIRVLPIKRMTDPTRSEPGKNLIKLKAVSSTGELSNIVNIGRDPAISVGTVNIKYGPPTIRGEAGTMASDIFWLPPDNYSMGVARLAQPVGPTDTQVLLQAPGTEEPPLPRFQSAISFGNDILDYDAMMVVLTQTGETRWITNEAERQNAIIDNAGYPVFFNGWIRIPPGQADRLQKFSADSSGGFIKRSVYPNNPWANGSGEPYFSYNPDPAHDDWIVNAPRNAGNGIKVAYKTYPALYESVVMKFKILQGAINTQEQPTKVGITLFNQSPNGVEAMYIIGCEVGDNRNLAGRNPYVNIRRVSKNGALSPVPRATKLSHPNDLGLPVPFGQWNYLECQISSQGAGHVFEVFLNGLKIGVFHDTIAENGGPLQRNATAGFFCQNGVMEIDKFIVLDIPAFRRFKSPNQVVVNQENKTLMMSQVTFFTQQLLSQPGRPRGGLRHHLKWTELDDIYSRYMGALRRRRNANIYMDDFSDTVTEYLEEEIRFDNSKDDAPAITCEMVNFNQNVTVEYFSTSPFGSKFRIRNHSKEPQLLSGQQDIVSSDANSSATQFIGIVGNPVIRTTASRIVSVNDIIQKPVGPGSNKFNRRNNAPKIDANKLDVDAPWCQTQADADRLAEWIIENQADGAEIYEVQIIGNPLLSIGDQVEIDYAEKGFLAGEKRFVIESIENSINIGYMTNITIRKIFPKPLEIKSGGLNWQQQ